MKSSSTNSMSQSSTGFGKTGFFRGLSLISAISFLLLPVQEVSAHGALGFPLARQYGCHIDGGYDWPLDGSGIPNAGCRAAFLANGKNSYLFDQWDEVTANPSNPKDFATVMKAVPDGHLCGAGDKMKRGLDVPQNEGWKKTVIEPKDGKFQLRWELTTPHNPATMHIYLSKPSYDPSKPLTWADLDQIYEEPAPKPVPANGKGLVPEVGNFYYLDVPIPANRTGDAIIYGYWQRIDYGHEGFFNCADVTIKQGSGSAKTDKESSKKEHAAEASPQWVQEKPYMERGFVPRVGDKVRFRVTDSKNHGQKIVDVTVPITYQNVYGAKWSKDLANTLNKKYKSQVKIGVQSGKNVKYNQWNVYANQVWLQSGYSSTMTIIKGKPSGKN
ncbi:hypothetical protein EC973_008785 [Apophysomyces ossiformis]|uniref:Chitin-binding protein n=1 Tax=Apophysomyces ossiformis TaxID=679940 RepID=A0A8H7BZ13_9FUNG|nr:hypothetical protein EC973_008785 [Apophysomyces ossiformis]